MAWLPLPLPTASHWRHVHFLSHEIAPDDTDTLRADSLTAAVDVICPPTLVAVAVLFALLSRISNFYILSISELCPHCRLIHILASWKSPSPSLPFPSFDRCSEPRGNAFGETVSKKLSVPGKRHWSNSIERKFCRIWQNRVINRWPYHHWLLISVFLVYILRGHQMNW